MENDLTTSAAAVSYFSMLALFPTLLLIITLGSRIAGPEIAETYVVNQVLAYLPGAQVFVRRNLYSITGLSNELIISSLLVMLWAASWLFTVIEKALNRIWGAYPRSFWRGRAVNFALMSLVWVLLGLSAIVTTAISALRAVADTVPLRFGDWATALSGFAWQSALIAASALITILLFTALYKFLPNKSVPLTDVLPGAILAGIIWEISKFGFASLLPYFNYDLLYGSIGAAVALLTWVYISSGIMLFGAQFTAVLSRERVHSEGRFRFPRLLHSRSGE